MKKFKRILSGLLASAMMISMIPLSAQAAEAEKSKMLVHVVDVQENFKSILTNATNYGRKWASTLGIDTAAEDLTLEDVKSRMKTINDVVTTIGDGTAESPIEVNVGETVYLAIDLDYKNPDQGGFGLGARAILEYPAGAITVQEKFLNPALMDETAVIGYTEYNEQFKNYFPGITTPFSIKGENEGDGQDGKKRYPFLFDSGSGYIPNEATWDALVPITVNVTGEVAIEIPQTIDTETVGIANCTTTSYNTGWLPTGDANKTGAAGETTIKDFEVNTVYLKAVDPSEGPSGSESDYVDSVDNKKNSPYYSLTQDDKVDVNEEWVAHTDFLTFPKNETTFVPTDTVVVYADNNGELGEEIGRTKIDGSNLYKNEGGTYKLQATTETVAGYSLPLIPAEGKLGDGYITGETAVWIGRLEAGEGKGISEKKVRIIVTPEEPIFYNGDVSVLEEGVPGSTAENPIKVHVGDKLSDVLAGLEDVVLPTAVDAPVEGAGKTVNTQLASQWSELVPDGVVDDIFTQHGSVVLKNAYQDTTATVSVPPIGEGEPQQVTLNYKQPLYENSKAIEPFGACIYIEVVPNPSDYFIVNSDSDTVTILGETQKYMTAGDTVKFYTAETGGGAIGTVTITDEVVTYDPNAGDTLPAVGQYVYVSYTNTGKTESLRVPVVVTDGTAEVNGNVDLGTIKIGTSATAAAVLADLSPVTFNIANAAEPWQQQFAMKEEKINGTDATLKATNVPEGSPIESTTDALALLNNPEKKAGTVFELSYTIPASTDNDMKTVEYRNTAGAKVLVKMEVLEEIPLTGEIAITVEENNPLGTDDTIKITGDTSGKLAAAVAANRAQIAIFTEDDVLVGVADNADITPEDKSGTWDYTVKVPQTARDKDTKLYLYTAYVGGAYLKQAEFTVTVDEKYSYEKAIQPASLTILKDDLLNYLDVENGEETGKPETYTVEDVEKYIAAELTNDAAIEYAYLMNHPTVGVNNYVPDPAATYTKEATGLTWSAPTEVTEYESEEGYTATATYTISGLQSSAAEGAKDALDIVLAEEDGTTVTFTRTVKVVTEQYTEEDTPKPSEIAAAITVTNNAYPGADEIKVTTPASITEPVVVTVYKDETKQDKLGSIQLTTGGQEETLTFDATADQYTGLDSMGGNVYFTVHSNDKAPSAPLAVKYDVEPYMLWEPAEISPTALSINKNDAGTLEAVTERLPKTMDAKVVHLQGKGNGVYEPKADESRNVPVDVGTWKVGSKELQLSDITAITSQIGEYGSGPATEIPLVVNTAYDSGAATLQTVVVTSGAGAQNEVAVKSSVNGPNGTIVTPPAGFDTADVTITFTNDPTKVKTELPDSCIITVNEGKTPNDANPANDTVEIDISKATNADGVKANGTVILEYTAPDGTIKTYESTAGDLTSGKLTITVTEGGFEGFDLSAGSFDVYFKEPNKERSDSIQIELPDVQLAIKIVDDVTVQTISLAAGSMDEAALTEMVNKVTSVDNVLMDSGEKITLSLVNTDGTIWTMQTGSAATSWTDKQVGEWTDVLAAVPEAGTEVRLIAHFDTASYDAADIVNDDPERLAIIKINLTKEYDPEDPSTAEGALVLTEGNSDIYNHLKPESDSTADEKALAKKVLDFWNTKVDPEETTTYKDYRTDLVYYFYLDAYEQADALPGNDSVERFVNPWITAEGTKGDAADYSQMLGMVDGTDAAEWFAAHPGATVDIDEVVVGDDGYGSSRAQLYEGEVAVGTDGTETATESHIEPRHSSNTMDYFTAAETSNTVRGEEYYKIVYTVTYTDADTGATEVYVATRNVKLRYKGGDTDLSNGLDGTDASNILTYSANAYKIFKDETGKSIPSLTTAIMDIDGSNGGDGTDASNILTFAANAYVIPNQRF